MFMISQKNMISKITEYAEKMQCRDPPIQEHLVYSHLICMYMYIYIYIYIYMQYLQRIYVCIMPFSEVTILFNQHFIIVGNTVGKAPTRILTLFI